MAKNSKRFGLYLMTEKGVAVLKRLLEELGSNSISFLITARDSATGFDGCEVISRIARDAGVPVYVRPEAPREQASYFLAVGWRWLIPVEAGKQLVILHDSLLPKYRGFAPVISALVNGDEKLGVTALVASERYDRGEVISQESIKVSYPIKISEAISRLIPCYEKLAIDVARRLLKGELHTYPQDEALATYSLWRDHKDYYVDWNWDAPRIQRFVDAVGFPYKGAAVTLKNELYRLRECVSLPDVKIENRTVGKTIFFDDGKPIVVCGQGLLKILILTPDGSEENVLPLSNFRVRFGGF